MSLADGYQPQQGLGALFRTETVSRLTPPSGSPRRSIPSSRRSSAPDVATDPLEPLSQKTTASIIAGRIRAAIMSGAFPPGTQLSEVELAARLRVSRGPVREALQRLIQEGLLRSERNRGVFVTTLDEDDVIDIYLSRRVIERAAVVAVLRRSDGEAVDRLAKIVQRMDVATRSRRWAEVADLDLSFHETLVEASGSKRLKRMLQTLLAETRMCLTALEPRYPIRHEIVEEHARLLDALRRGDKEEVLRLLDGHLDDAVRALTGGAAGTADRSGSGPTG
jgi:DNA-binding GntR family transcriptional regulator